MSPQPSDEPTPTTLCMSSQPLSPAVHVLSAPPLCMSSQPCPLSPSSQPCPRRVQADDAVHVLSARNVVDVDHHSLTGRDRQIARRDFFNDHRDTDAHLDFRCAGLLTAVPLGECHHRIVACRLREWRLEFDRGEFAALFHRVHRKVVITKKHQAAAEVLEEPRDLPTVTLTYGMLPTET
jgi:hypothetical protein